LIVSLQTKGKSGGKAAAPKGTAGREKAGYRLSCNLVEPPVKLRSLAETLTITLLAISVSMVLFGILIAAYAKVSPADLYRWMLFGGFGTKLAWQRALTRAAPLILTALCTALPARLGLIIIGGEGALLAGGLAAVAVGLNMVTAPAWAAHLAMGLAACLAGGFVIALAGGLRHWRGVNATISSLLVAYIIIGVFNFLVEGPMKDPASLNKPSTYPIPEEMMLGVIPGLGVHWGLLYGVVFCLAAYVLMYHTTFGFAAQMAGGNVRAAQGAGLPVGRLILITCLLGGAAAGLAGMVEIAAVNRQANATLIAGYGFTGILVSFIARHHPLGIIPVAILFGGLDGCSGTLQKQLKLPDATIGVLMGTMFVLILLCETLYGRWRIFQPREVREAMAR
jgi:simple sugar transport system permease protein